MPKFDLGKFDGSPLHWPLWFGRFKSIVHDQPFLNDSQCLAYLQNTVTGAAEAEIQFLGEYGANYISALRMLKARFAYSGKIVRVAITALKVIPSPHPQDQTGLAKLYQTLRSTIVTLHGGKATVVMCCQLGLRSDAILIKLIYPGIWRGYWKVRQPSLKGEKRFHQSFLMKSWVTPGTLFTNFFLQEPSKLLSKEESI